MSIPKVDWKDSHYFKPKIDPRLKCRCCGMMAPHPVLIQLLNFIRKDYGDVIIMVSGTRCTKHNTKVDGAVESYHIAMPRRGVISMAADIRPKGLPNIAKLDRLYRSCKKMLNQFHGSRGGLIRYGKFIHVDIRHKRYREDRRRNGSTY